MTLTSDRLVACLDQGSRQLPLADSQQSTRETFIRDLPSVDLGLLGALAG